MTHNIFFLVFAGLLFLTFINVIVLILTPNTSKDFVQDISNPDRIIDIN